MGNNAVLLQYQAPASRGSPACAGAFGTVYRARVDGAIGGLFAVAVTCYTSSLKPHL